MTVELIPVLEIGYSNQGLQAPDSYPYWKHAAVWDDYRRDSFAKAGFKDPLPPYLPGSPFVTLPAITDANLAKLARDHTAELREDILRGEACCTFFGGYVLRIDGQDRLFPQCCGLLEDISYWEQLAAGNTDVYYEGHPAPVVTISNGSLLFDLTEQEEPFQPAPPDTLLQVDRRELEKAVGRAKEELQQFAARLRRINEEDPALRLPDIEKLLIGSS